MKALGGGQIVNTISGITGSAMALQSMYAATATNARESSIDDP
ncbi:hypothetical protein [Acetobacterium sp.]